MLIYPVSGRLVRCPVTKRPVPEDGLDVSEHDLFWARRLRDEDVSPTPTAPAVSAPEEAPVTAAAEAGGLSGAAPEIDVTSTAPEPSPPAAEEQD